MKKQKIQERNKQIALMLGWIFDEYGFISKSPKHSFIGIDHDLKFHSDWAWLMEAVEFIHTKFYTIEISTIGHCQIKGNPPITKNPHIGYLSDDLKEALFMTVSDFAKQYNEKNNE